MELYQIRYFLKVAEQLSFRRAANLLFISQAALSQQINNLEKELGMRLLYRDNQKVSLLPEGKVFYERSKKLVEEADKLFDYMRSLREDVIDHQYLKVAFDKEEDGLSNSKIIDVILELKETYSEIKLELNYLSYEECQNAIESDNLDIGFFTLRKVDYEKFKYKKKILWEDRLCLAVHNSLTGSAQELLEKYPLIQLKEDKRWEGMIHKKVKRICKNYQIKYVDTITNSLGYVSMLEGIIPAILSQVRNESNLRPIGLEFDEGENDIIIAALWKNDKKWINKILDTITG